MTRICYDMLFYVFLMVIFSIPDLNASRFTGMVRSLDAMVARKWKIIHWRRCCRPTWLMLGLGTVMVTWCWCMASIFFDPLNILNLHQVTCFPLFPE